jgi:hypothetical protein
MLYEWTYANSLEKLCKTSLPQLVCCPNWFYKPTVNHQPCEVTDVMFANADSRSPTTKCCHWITTLTCLALDITRWSKTKALQGLIQSEYWVRRLVSRSVGQSHERSIAVCCNKMLDVQLNENCHTYSAATSKSDAVSFKQRENNCWANSLVNGWVMSCRNDWTNRD